MDDRQSSNILVAGYPAVGKTTYLAALWYVLNHSDEINTNFKIFRLHGEHAYLNRIADDWMSYREVERTKMLQEPKISIEIEDTTSKSVFQLTFPDLDGERFRQQFEQRQCTEDYAEYVHSSKGFLVFIHCGKITFPTKISDAEATIEVIESAPFLPQVLDGGRSGNVQPVPWEPSLCPTQVKYVELLQFLLHLSMPTSPLRLAIVLSAWDLVDKTGLSPNSFLSQHLPLLHQYLSSNSDFLDVQAFGISAQGIDLVNSTAVGAFADSNIRPSDRIVVCDGDAVCISHDITKPIRWIL